MRRGLLLMMAGAIGLALTGALYADGQAVTVTAHEADRRVDITIGGQPFTSYIWPTTIKKPVLYPLRTAKGVVISRGYPLDPRPGERVDHPHHVGLWFNYGNVDGYDFWNNSDAIEAERQPHMGTVYHRAIRRATSGPEGVLEIEADWVIPDGTVLLKETYDVRVPRHRDDADDRSHDDADGRGKGGVARRQQGRRPRPAPALHRAGRHHPVRERRPGLPARKRRGRGRQPRQRPPACSAPRSRIPPTTPRRTAQNAASPGMVALQRWLEANVRGVFWGSYRCEKWGKHSASLHAENRAIDWHLDVHDAADRRAAEKLDPRCCWRPTRAGNPQALARRMGVEEMIWDCGYWGAGMTRLQAVRRLLHKHGKRRKHVDPTVRHRDHIHIGMTKAGAEARTCFWTSLTWCASRRS